MQADLKTLIAKLNPPCRKALEGAASLCLAQTHHSIELEHLLLKLLEQPETDLQRLFRYYEINPQDVTRELTQALEKFQRGNTRTPSLSPIIVEWVQQSWVVSSIQLGETMVRTGAMLMALFETDALRSLLLNSTVCIAKISREALRRDIWEILRTSNESPGTSPSESASSVQGGRAQSGKTPALDQYTLDLTAQARQGKIDPIRGRDAEIRQIIDILMRRRQNNPILTGEAGVGKTAVVEGFALRVALGDVPPALKNILVRVLDLGLLQAGAGIKGEFEERLKSVIQEVKNAVQPIILFIDEAHTMIGAGGAAGQNDAANLLKPALARGELRTIAATTWSEYKKYFEKDPALARRFQVVPVEEPSESAAIEMLRGLVANLEKHHKVRILDEALREAVQLSHRYISGRQLPDKAIGVLDTACARVAIGQNSTPSALEEAIRRIEHLETEIQILQREQLVGKSHTHTLQALQADVQEAQSLREALQQRWQAETQLVQKITSLQQELGSGEAGSEHPEIKRLLSELARLEKDLEALQGEEPMVATCVDGRVVANVVANWTGIPVGKMLADEVQTLLHLQEAMQTRVVGQSTALEMICRRIRTARARLDDPGKPIGVFLLVGPSGVGKTETALTLADLLYGGESNLITVNMSEYQEAHTVSGLKGAPPGYVGYGQGGVLTEAVRRNPYSVVLLDEIEKAHGDVVELFYQVFDKGTLEDGEGVSVNFKNTILLLTSNLGAEAILEASPSEGLSTLEDLQEEIRQELLSHFAPAFLGRLVIVPYFPLKREEVEQIVRLKLEKIARRFQSNHLAQLLYDAQLVPWIAERCTDIESGARTIDHFLTQTLLPELSSELLERMASGQSFSQVCVTLEPAGTFRYHFQP